MRKFAEFWLLCVAAGALFLLSDRLRGGVADSRAGDCFALFAFAAGIVRMVTSRPGLDFLWDEFAATCIIVGVGLAATFGWDDAGSHGWPPPMCLFLVVGLGLWTVAFHVGAAVLGRWSKRRCQR